MPDFDEQPSRRVWVLTAAIVLLIAMIAVIVIASSSPSGQAGELSEPSIDLPANVPLPSLVNATQRWGLDQLDASNNADYMSGGAAFVDLDGNGAGELVIANGDVVVLTWVGDGFGAPISLGIDQATSVTTADLDGDGAPELLVGRSADDDSIVWGGAWFANRSAPDISSLVAPGQTGGLLAAELTGDGVLDIVRLGRGPDAAPDLVWQSNGVGARSFSAVELPVAGRASLAGEVFDADADGLVDIWITRDLGWANGPDSVFSRSGVATGAWTDVAEQLGADLEVDGMGVTIADLNGDGLLDGYVSDLGDNEVLLSGGTGAAYVPTIGTGAARIRPPSSGSEIISSSWASGPIDVNLDGVLDIVVVGGGFPGVDIRNKIADTQIAETEPPAVLLGVGDGTYVDVWPQLDLDVAVTARGMTIADVDGDGDDDIIIVEQPGGVTALENRTAGPAIGFVSDNCSGLGASLLVNTGVANYHVLFDRHAYASQHGHVVNVGVPVGTVSYQLRRPGLVPSAPEELVVAGSGRPAPLVLNC